MALTLPCFKRVFMDALVEDSLVVMARGVGIKTILCKFVHLYATSTRPGEVVIVLNASDSEHLLNDWLLADGLPVTRLQRVLDSVLTVPERGRMDEAWGVV